MERSKSELSLRNGSVLPPVALKSNQLSTSGGSLRTSIGLNVSASTSNLPASASFNTSSANTAPTGTVASQNPKRKSRFGSLYQSLLTSESSEGTLSPNSVRGIMNPIRSQMGLPPLEMARLSTSPEIQPENTDSPSPSTLAALSASATSNITPPTPGDSTEEVVSPDLDASPVLAPMDNNTQPQFVQDLPTVPLPAPRPLFSIPEDQNVPPRSVPPPVIAAVVRPQPLPIHSTPVGSKSFCPPPALPSGPGSSSLRSQGQRSNAPNRSAKKPSSGWRFPTESVGDKEYLIMKQIGKGGSGEVSLAMEKETRGLYALKKIHLGGLDQSGVDECINEIKLLVELKDTNLVIHIECWEMNPSDRTIKIVMEFGQCDLSKSISSDKAISLNKVKSIWERMLQIVQTIHQRGIVHADLKPANFVWVGGNLKIIDFGIANKLQPEFTSIATLNPKGTLNFISPETVNQDVHGRTKISPKSDIWSLGCILYFMVFGRTPFQNIVHQMAKINAIIRGVISYPPLPAQFEGSSVISVLQHCFQTDPKQRPSATQLLTHPFLQNHESLL